MSIRWRLTLWFTAVLSILAIIGALFFYVAFRNWVVAQRIDSNLKAYSTLALVPLVTENADYTLVRSIWTSLDNPSSPDTSVYIQLIDGDRSIVLKSENLGEEVLPTDLKVVKDGLGGIPGIATTSSSGNASLRVQVIPLQLNGQTHVMEVAQSLASINPAMTRMGLTLLVVIPLIILLVMISAAILIGRALSPVKKVTATAQSIASSSDLGRRVGYKGPADEVGQLAATFDRMIDQLDKLMQSQRSFVADASHELRGPLTVIQGNLDLLKRNLNEEDRKESLRALEAEATRMAGVVNDLLVLAEVESGQLERQQMVSLKELLLDAQERAQPLAGDRRILIGRQEDLWVKGDPHRLEQLIGNLVSNAIKYTPEGGTITLSLFGDGEWARIEVSDTGIGIPPEHLPHIFDRFYRVDKSRSRAGGGTGLGLAIVKGIAEQHGGKVTVTSEPGKGSTFSVWLRI